MNVGWKIFICFFGLLFSFGFAKSGKSALTPPMGWNSWNTFAGNISESLIKQVVDSMVSKGMRDAGYVYVNLDDNWMASPARDSDNGVLKADPTRFPDGIKGLADYIHKKGMKLGIYSDRGTKTCLGVARSGGYGNEELDARTYASWGVDYLKYDNCNTVGDMEDDYTTMGNALDSSGRDIVFSICAWQTKAWMPAVGHLWRSSEDITASWTSGATSGWSIMSNLDQNSDDFIFTRPGAWADPDMLEVGRGSLSVDENKAHFGLWALMASPLIAGNDVRSMSATTLALLTHPEVIAIDQDSAGIQGRRIRSSNNLEVWAKPLGYCYNEYAIGLFNRSSAAAGIAIHWSEIHLNSKSVTVRDVWEKKDLGSYNDSFSVQVPSHGLALLRVKGELDTSSDIWASDLHVSQISNGWNYLQIDKSNGGNALKIGSQSYAKGFGTNAASTTYVYLYKNFSRFQSDIGVDAEVSSGSVMFEVYGDDSLLYTSSVLKGGGGPASIDVSVKGVDTLKLVVSDGNDGTSYDHGDWGGAKLIPVTTGSSSLSSSSSVTQRAYSAAAIPGTIQAENYDIGGQGVAYSDDDTENKGSVYRTDEGVDITGDAAGGYKVGWTIAGEWLEYTVDVAAAGVYKWTACVASGSDSSSFHILLDNATDITGTVRVPGTGDWETYTTVSGTTPNLSAGTHVLRLVIDGSYFNIDWIDFTDTTTVMPISAANFRAGGGMYGIYSVLGIRLGTVDLSGGGDMRVQVGSLVNRSGIYLLRETDGGRSYWVEIHK